jgi:F-type H+-transporting ATPase subunit a
MGILVLIGWAAGRALKRYPGRFQAMMEMIVDAFDNLCRETLGERGRKYVPYIGSLFILLWVSNLIGIIPFFEEPTRDINTPVALAVVAIAVAQVSAIRVNGWKKWAEEFCEPAPRIYGIPIPLMLPLNIVGEIGKAISLPFRLFGNIFGGAVIILVISSLIMYVGLPPFLNFFFGIFVGTIQAFVFTMLSLTYVAVAIGGEEEEALEEAVKKEPS